MTNHAATFSAYVRENAGDGDHGPKGDNARSGYSWERLRVRDALTAEPKPTVWTVGGIAAKGEAVTINAQGGLGKTYLLAQIAMDAATGRPALGLYAVPGPLKVLWIDEEMGTEMLSNRFSRLALGNHLDAAELELLDANFDIRPQQGLTLKDPEHFAVYDRALRDGKYDLVVMDSLVALDQGPENEGNAARDFYRRFIAPYKGTLGTSFLIAAHPSKPSKEAHPDAQKMTRGSVDKRNSMDRTFWLEKHAETITPDSHVLTVILHRDKQRQAGSVDGHLIQIDGPADKPVCVRSLGETGSAAAVDTIGKVGSCQHEILARLRAAVDRRVYQADLIVALEALGYDKRRHYYPAINGLAGQGYIRVIDRLVGSGKPGKWIELLDGGDDE